MITTATLLALGVFAVIELVKWVLPVRLRASAKLILAVVLSGLLAALVASGVTEGVVMASGIFGLSMLLHGLHKTLEASGDERRTETIFKGSRR